VLEQVVQGRAELSFAHVGFVLASIGRCQIDGGAFEVQARVVDLGVP
jgi:hypothetical protein